MGVEQDPMYFTVVIKGSGVFGTSRKWRLLSDSRPAIARLDEEFRRILIDFGNSDACNG